jgi:hypothetical protein
VGLNQGLAADLGLLAGGRSWAGDDSHAPDRVLGSAERFITLFHRKNRTGPPGRRLRQVRRPWMINLNGGTWTLPCAVHDTATAASAAPVSGKRL